MFKSSFFTSVWLYPMHQQCANQSNADPPTQAGALGKVQSQEEKNKQMLSRDCDGCSQMKPCSKRFVITKEGEKVYCPDGTAHLVDGT